MSDLNAQVIEAAEQAIAETMWTSGLVTSDLTMLEDAARAAIAAADAARAPAIRAAIGRLELAVAAHTDAIWSENSIDARTVKAKEQKARAARRDLLALFGITEDTP